MIEIYVVTCTVHGSQWEFADIADLNAFLVENVVGDAVFTVKRDTAFIGMDRGVTC